MTIPHSDTTSPSTMELKPSDLGLSVPGDAWRAGQWDAASRVALSPKRYVLLEGPPGTGKSLIARGAARLIDARRTHFLTGTIQLQQQYERDGMVRAVGRSNFECAIEPLSADSAICTVGGKCEHAGRKGVPGCPYYDQKRVAAAAPEAVFNYAWWLRSVNYSGFPRPEFLVADEAHTLKDHVRSFAEVQVLRSSVARVGLRLPRSEADVAAWRDWAKEARAILKPTVRKTEAEPPEPGDHEGVRYARALQSLWKATGTLSTIDDDWIIIEDKYGTVLKPVWVHHWVPSLALDHAQKKVLLMSATILNKEVFCQLNGIPEEETEFIQLGSSFRVSRRPVRYRPVAERGGRNVDNSATLAAVRTAVSEQPGERVLIHTVSNWLATAVAEDLRSAAKDQPGGEARAIISHGQRDRVDALQRFRDTPGSVLVSPSMHTGVDLPDDLLRAQVITRLPFPDMSDPLVKAQMKNATRDNPLDKGQRAYTYDTAAALVQTYGRIMRSEDDWGVTYLLDPAWRWFRHAARDFLPKWFTEAVRLDSVGVQSAPVDTNDPDAFVSKFLAGAR